jgi:hypothetical protein
MNKSSEGVESNESNIKSSINRLKKSWSCALSFASTQPPAGGPPFISKTITVDCCFQFVLPEVDRDCHCQQHSTMADLMFSLGQTKGKKKTEKKVKETKDKLKDVTITETVESVIRGEQHNREIQHKETARNQIKENMNVTVTDTVEGDIRKEHNTREIKHKETARNQIKENTNFDMARSLFGGGGGEEQEEDEEE